MDHGAVSENFFISNSLVICPDHEDVKLSSKLTTNEDLLSDNARFLIVLIKSKNQEEAKQDILNEIANESLNDQNKTIHEEQTKTEVLKIENTILKRLNTELRDKILLLKELLAIEKSKDNKSSATKSCAEIVTSTKPPLKRIPKLIVKTNNKNEKLNIKNYVTEMISKDTNIHAKGITVKSENEVIIICVDENSVNITEHMSNMCGRT